jgi:hypothetical protein
MFPGWAVVPSAVYGLDELLCLGLAAGLLFNLSEN